MAYGCNITKLLDVLAVTSPEKAWILKEKFAVVEHGLLSVGLKLHGLNLPKGFVSLVASLGGRQNVLDRNVYKKAGSEFCLVLPPVGSAWAAQLLLECIATHTGCRIFGNQNMHLQVCSPGRLEPRRTALLAIGFYLGSDTLRQYALTDFTTTVSYEYYDRGRRIVLYDASLFGDFDRGFEWWERNPLLAIRPSLPFEHMRTDILAGPCSPLDIENINLIATLLMHAQYKDHAGCWHETGLLFEERLTQLLRDHLLMGLLDAPWVHAAGKADARGDQEFFEALKELTSYALGDAHRISNPKPLERFCQKPKQGILNEVRDLLTEFRDIVQQLTVPRGGIHGAL